MPLPSKIWVFSGHVKLIKRTLAWHFFGILVLCSWLLVQEVSVLYRKSFQFSSLHQLFIFQNMAVTLPHCHSKSPMQNRKARKPPYIPPCWIENHSENPLKTRQVKGGVSEGDFKFKLVTVGDSGVRKLGWSSWSRGVQ